MAFSGLYPRFSAQSAVITSKQFSLCYRSVAVSPRPAAADGLYQVFMNFQGLRVMLRTHPRSRKMRTADYFRIPSAAVG
jgi:hypothetical protein